MSVFGFVKLIKPRGPVRHILFDFVEVNQKVHALNFFSKIPPVQRSTKNNFINPLKLGQRELIGQEFKSDRLGGDFALHASVRRVN